MQALRILWAGLLLLSQVAAGQSFAYRAQLGAAPADSFYRVLLPPAITGRLQPDLADIRLYDETTREVPYLLVRAERGPAAGPDGYQPVEALAFEQYGNLRHKKTILRFSSSTPVLIDKLVFTIAAPTLYHRQATLYERRETKNRGSRRRRHRRGRLNRDYQAVTSFVLTADQDSSVLLSGFRSRDFYVEIQNNDSPPLVVQKVVAYQLPTYLVAPLEAGKTYHLAFGHQEPIAPPAYDLTYFWDKIPREIPTLRPQEIEFTGGGQEKKSNLLNTFFTNRHLIWAALLTVIAFLAYMSYKMLKETGKRREDLP
jgi:hypothetical protein